MMLYTEMIMIDNNRDYKKEMIDKIYKDLQHQAQTIHEDPTMSVQDQLTQMNIIWNLCKFLDHYDENIVVLNQYTLNKDRRKRLMQGYDRD